MYKIKIITKQPIAKKQEEILVKSVQEADPHAQYEQDGASCIVKGSSTDPQVVSYLLGILMGSSPSSEIVKLQLSYEK